MLQSHTPVSNKGRSVMGPKYHQIRPNKHPHVMASPGADARIQNRPNFDASSHIIMML